MRGEPLEPEVHIVERYMQLVKKCFTMTNVMLEGGKEIDLLAVNPISGEKYHVEVRVTIDKGFRIRLKDTQTKDGRKHRRGLDTLNSIKFKPVAKAAEGIFGTDKYKRVLVVWEVEDESVIEQARRKPYEIKIWKLPVLLSELVKEVKTRGYRDDVLRTIQLISISHFLSPHAMLGKSRSFPETPTEFRAVSSQNQKRNKVEATNRA